VIHVVSAFSLLFVLYMIDYQLCYTIPTTKYVSPDYQISFLHRHTCGCTARLSSGDNLPRSYSGRGVYRTVLNSFQCPPGSYNIIHRKKLQFKMAVMVTNTVPRREITHSPVGAETAAIFSKISLHCNIERESPTEEYASQHADRSRDLQDENE
jgi:hypothetical protein